MRDWWVRMTASYDNLMKVFVPWVTRMSGKGIPNDDYLFYTMHHYPEFIAFITRKKLNGEYHEPKR